MMKPAGLLSFSIPILVTAVLVSCADQVPTAPGADFHVRNLASGHASRNAVRKVAQNGGGLLKCSPLPPDSVTETFDRKGGTLEVGPHSLWIPPQALSESVSITAVAPSDTVNLVRFQPEGLIFAKPAELTMSYHNCGTRGPADKIRIAYVTDSLVIVEYLRPADDHERRKVSGLLDHFSGYAVAW